MEIKTPTLQELLEAGVHFGHQVRRGNPRMNEYIFGVRDGVHIVNLELSEKKLKEAVKYVYELGEAGKVLLFVGTKKQAQGIVEELAKKVNAPYVTARWLGGFLTNFDEIRKNIRLLLDLKDKKEKGELSKYTKKEQLLISRKLERFEKELGGLALLDKLPDALFVIDCVAEKTALKEANRLHIPVVGIADTNSNPDLMDYPIPGNDDAIKSIKILAEAVTDAYQAGLKKVGQVKKALEKKEQKEEIEEIDGAIIEDVAAAEEKVEKEVVSESERVV